MIFLQNFTPVQAAMHNKIVQQCYAPRMKFSGFRRSYRTRETRTAQLSAHLRSAREPCRFYSQYQGHQVPLPPFSLNENCPSTTPYSAGTSSKAKDCRHVRDASGWSI